MFTSRIDQVVSAVTTQIQQGLFAPGSRVLSIRAAAEAYGFSRNTVVEAYERMIAMGYLESRPGSGYYVVFRHQPPSVKRVHEVAQAVDTVSLLREQLVRDYRVRIGDGRPPEAWMEKFDLHRAGRLPSLEPEKGMQHGYGNPWGFGPLRDRIAHMLNEREIVASLDQIMLTHGANHALDLVARQLLQPGDVALVDCPGYYPLFGKLKFSDVKLVGVRRQPDGPEMQDLERKIRQYQPRVFFTQSQAHNPTGGGLSLPKAHRILKLADQYGLYVIEDDPFADILSSDAVRLAMLDQLERVIYIGTFSKTLSAALRVGYLAANAALAKALCDLNMLTLVSTSDFSERIILGLIDSGQYRRHLRQLKSRVERATVTACTTLGDLGLQVFCDGGGGFYLWAMLPDGINEMDLTTSAANEGIFLAPGSLFHTSRQDQERAPALRINVAYAADPTFIEFMKRYLSAN